jgi:DDE superfamily endonuclease
MRPSHGSTNTSATVTVSLLAGIDLVTGKVHALVKDRHRSREFIEFLELLDAAYPAHTAIKLILDNHSAHISKETKAWLAAAGGHPLCLPANCCRSYATDRHRLRAVRAERNRLDLLRQGGRDDWFWTVSGDRCGSQCTSA